MTPEAVAAVVAVVERAAAEKRGLEWREAGKSATAAPVATRPRSINAEALEGMAPTRSNGTENPARVRSALWSGMPPRGYAEWLPLVWAARDALGDAGREVVREWSARDPEKFDAAAFDVAWNSDKRPSVGGVTASTLFAWARANGWKDEQKSASKAVNRPEPARPTVAVLTCAADIMPEPVEWLWTHFLARGKLHVFAGAPGQGKTTIAIAFAATVSSGGRWPDASRCTPGRVVIWSGEDDPADTLVPRLKAAGADMARIHFVTGAHTDDGVQSFDPAHDMPLLLEACETVGGVSLVVIDPIVSAVAGDSHKGAETRRALQPLVDLGAALNAAVLGISHFSKGTAGKDPTERVTGSYAFGAVARVVLVAARIQGRDGGPEKRILARSKSNIGPDDGGFEYSLQQVEALPGIFASRVVWGAAVEGTARELLAFAEADPGKVDADSISADAFLRDALARGPVAARTLQADANGAGCSWPQVKRASIRLGISKSKSGMQGGWMWSMPGAGAAEGNSEGPEGEEGSAFRNVSPSTPSAFPSESCSESDPDSDTLLEGIDDLMHTGE